MNAIKLFVVLLGSMVFAAGCKDKAADDYAKCVQDDAQGDVHGAWLTCGYAVHDDPTSKSGVAAASKLVELKPKYDTWKVADDAQQAKEADQRRMLAAAKLIEVRLRVQAKYFSEDPDSMCTGKGFPPYHWDYSGGTFAEDEEIAEADGCRALYSMGGQNTDFCCPKAPNL